MRTSVSEYYDLVKHRTRIIILMGIILIGGVILSLNIGPVQLSLSEMFSQKNSLSWKVFYSIRLPRVLADLIAGAGLAMSGLAMQKVLRNPLASPFTLGISGAASFGAAFSIVIIGVPALTVFSQFVTPVLTGLAAFLFSMLSVMMILFVIKHRGSRPSVIVLAGIMTSSLFSASTSALQFFADDRQLAEIIFWTFGDPGRTNYTLLLMQSSVILPVIFWMIHHRWDFALLQSGDDSAKAGGLDPARFRLIVLILASLVTSLIVSGYGIIGFVGLVAPHLCRLFFRGREISTGSALLFGAIFMLISDSLARIILQPVILPVGIVTAFFGAPFFILLLIGNREL